jgi:hypothetical protein
MSEEHHHFFYDKNIVRRSEAAIVEEILSKYRCETADEVLKEKIWNELQMAKYEGKVSIPFQVVLRRQISGGAPDYIEVILDTKV